MRIPFLAKKLKYSPDGKLLASTGPCTIWDAGTGQEVTNLKFLRFMFMPADIAYSGDGQDLILATTGEAHNLASLAGKPAERPGFTVDVINVANQKASGGFQSKGVWGRAVLNRDGSRVALMPFPTSREFLADRYPPRFVTVHDTRTGRELSSLALPKDHLVAARFHPDGQLLTVSLNDKVLRFWDVLSGKQTRTIYLGDYPLHYFVVSADGRRLAAASLSGRETDKVKVWDLQTEFEIASFPGHAGAVTTLALSPDGRRLATGGSDKAVKIWDVDERREELTLRGHQAAITDVTFSPDGSRVATSDGTTKGAIRIWNVGPIEEMRGP
jgi:WD40 repeat protein